MRLQANYNVYKKGHSTQSDKLQGQYITKNKKNQNKIVLKKSGRFFYFRKEQKIMQIFLLSIIFILICVLVYQGREIRDLERKTLGAFKIVCQKINTRKEGK